MLLFLKRYLSHIQSGAWSELHRKNIVLFKLLARIFTFMLLLPLTLLIILIIRLLRPFILIRFGKLISSRIGHFSANTELYLCERDASINIPKQQRFVDVFYMAALPICNKQLEKMWRRVLLIWPSRILAPVTLCNKVIFGGNIHEIGQPTCGDRDVHNLLEQFPPRIEFTEEEIRKGNKELNNLGVPNNSKFICFHARENHYLKKVFPRADYSYHNYLEVDIENYRPAVEELCCRGNFLLRAGAFTEKPFKISHPMMIDYAWNYRSDFLDIYLAANCKFYLLSPTGLYAVPTLFRRPVALTNVASIEYVESWSENKLSIFKKYWLITEKRFMTFREIFASGAGRFLSKKQYDLCGIELIENTPEEIKAVAIEMDERIEGTWITTEEDEDLQKRFWSIFPNSELHGQIKSLIGAEYLRANRDLLK